ncbi:MAG: hypothetical protein OS112_04315 [Methanoregula sp.]|nr:MAG: hypothetical protein OS112_04315 [Methanoregula sp.]
MRVLKLIRPYFEPGLPKTPDPDPNMTGLFWGFLDIVPRIIAIIASFALNMVFVRFKNGLFKPVWTEDLTTGRPRIQVWKRTPVLRMPGSGLGSDRDMRCLTTRVIQLQKAWETAVLFRTAVSDGRMDPGLSFSQGPDYGTGTVLPKTDTVIFRNAQNDLCLA